MTVISLLIVSLIRLSTKDRNSEIIRILDLAQAYEKNWTDAQMRTGGAIQRQRSQTLVLKSIILKKKIVNLHTMNETHTSTNCIIYCLLNVFILYALKTIFLGSSIKMDFKMNKSNSKKKQKSNFVFF